MDLTNNTMIVNLNCLTFHMGPNFPKGDLYTCTISRHTFHRQLIAVCTSMDQQYMCLILLKVEQSAFTQASFPSLSDVHECSGGL